MLDLRIPNRPSSPAEVTELDRILMVGGLRPVFQPIVELDSAAVVGWEGLTRGPAGSPLETPDQLFGAARRAGRLADLEWACRAVVMRGALDAGLGSHGSLFVNVEPSVDGRGVPAGVVSLGGELADRGTPVMVEFTERALTARPAALLQSVERYRRMGWGVALDDVGVDPRSVALMPFVRPDVIKLDMRFVQKALDAGAARAVNAVVAEAERTGARVLAEGIETDEHRRIAVALGATLGQGWLHGRPGPLVLTSGPGARPLRRHTAQAVWAAGTPFQILTASRPPREATKRMLLQMSLQLETEAVGNEAAVVLSCFQERRHLTARSAVRYERLASGAALVVALGCGLGEEPVPGVRGVTLDSDDPLRLEWDVVVLTPHFAAAFAAEDLGDTGVPDMDRRFSFSLTYDRELVAEAAASLLCRVAPA